MTLFEAIGKPGWQHRKAEVRMAAVDGIDDPGLLVELIRNDPDKGVRLRALARLSDSAELDRLADSGGLPDEVRRQARKQRLSQLLPDPELLQKIEDDLTLTRIAGLSDSADLACKAVARISDTALLVEVACGHPIAAVRLCAAQRVADEEHLRDLQQRVRHSDKSVYRLCRAALERIQDAERAGCERRALIEKTLADAAQLRSMPKSPEYPARHRQLTERWQGLRGEASPEVVEQVESDLRACTQRIEEWERERAAEEQRLGRAEAAARAFPALLEELAALSPVADELRSDPALADLGRCLDGIEERWVAATLHAEPSAEQTEECKRQLSQWRRAVQTCGHIVRHSTSLEGILQQAAKTDKQDFSALQSLRGATAGALKDLRWPDDFALPEPETRRRLREQLVWLDGQLETLRNEEERTLERVKEAFAELKQGLDENHFHNADRSHNRVRNLIRHLPPGRQKRLLKELQPLSLRLKDVHAWQNFAVEPKKAELCTRMKALAGAPDNPRVLAEKIKALQQEWKALGPIAPRREQALWKEFHAAAEAAYEPCKAAFRQESKLRKQNYRKRMELVAALDDYERRMHWPDREDALESGTVPDWYAVRKTLKTARQTFAELTPVGGKAERVSRQSLKEVCDRIYSHLQAEYDRNIALKEDLLARAQTCAELEDLREATRTVKNLQSEWKQVGLTPRGPDRRLWKAFHAACDAVFSRLDEKHAERRAAEWARAEKAAARQKRERARWPLLFARMRACALKEQDESTAVELWEREGELPPGIDVNALTAWWEEGPGTADEAALRESCIELEALTGAESPESDRDARMAWQMQRLVEGLGQARNFTEQELIEPVNAFIALRPSAEWLDRFIKACAAKVATGSEKG